MVRIVRQGARKLLAASSVSPRRAERLPVRHARRRRPDRARWRSAMGCGGLGGRLSTCWACPRSSGRRQCICALRLARQRALCQAQRQYRRHWSPWPVRRAWPGRRRGWDCGPGCDVRSGRPCRACRRPAKRAAVRMALSISKSLLQCCAWVIDLSGNTLQKEATMPCRSTGLNAMSIFDRGPGLRTGSTAAPWAAPSPGHRSATRRSARTS